MLTKVDHIAFVVNNLDREIEFYRDVLGLEFILRRIWDEEYVRRMVGIPDAVLDIALLKLPGKEGSPLAADGSLMPGKGDSMLELIEYKHPKGTPVDNSPNTPGNAHIAFLVDDMDEIVARVRAANVEIIGGPLEAAAGPNLGRKVAYLRDPDGIIVQLMQG